MVTREMLKESFIGEEIKTRHNPPDHPLVALSFACFAGVFGVLPAFFPNPEEWRSRVWYIQLVIGSIFVLMGVWVIIMVTLMLVDHISKRPSFPSEQVGRISLVVLCTKISSDKQPDILRFFKRDILCLLAVPRKKRSYFILCRFDRTSSTLHTFEVSKEVIGSLWKLPEDCRGSKHLASKVWYDHLFCSGSH
jgi:hypothetical protein